MMLDPWRIGLILNVKISIDDKDTSEKRRGGTEVYKILEKQTGK